MRLALVLLLVVGCAKKAADAPAPTEPADRAAATSEATPAPTTPTTTGAAPPLEAQQDGVVGRGGADAPKGGEPDRRNQGVAEARASGVLGPTDQHVFTIKSSVSIKRASTKQLDTAAKTNLDAVKVCYDKALEFNETLAGELTMTVKDGKATVAKSTLKNPELENCVVSALTALPASGKATLVLAFKRE